jgi:hypothetical protein
VPQVPRPRPLAAERAGAAPDRRAADAEVLNVLVSVSAAVLLGALVWLLWRYANVRAWHAALCALFGFYLASSSSGPHIASALRALARTISTLHL